MTDSVAKLFKRPGEKNLPRHRATIAAFVTLHFLIAMSTSSALLADQSLKIGIYQNKPKIFQRADGSAAGFFVDLLDAIAETEDWKIEYVPCAWDECLSRLERAELDLMADVADTPLRRGRFDLGREVVFSSWSVIYARPNHGIESVLDLENKKVAVLRNSIQSQVLKRLTKNFDVAPRFIEVSSFAEAYKLVEDHDADCVVVNRFYGKLHESSSKLIKYKYPDCSGFGQVRRSKTRQSCHSRCAGPPAHYVEKRWQFRLLRGFRPLV